MSNVASCSEDSRCPSDLSNGYIYDGESVQNESIYSLPNTPTCVSLSHPNINSSELAFTTKDLHFCNLNVLHILPKLDELRILMANDKFADILGPCESFLDPSIMDQQVAIKGYEFIRKDRMETRNKTGGGLILYFRLIKMQKKT